MDEEFGYDSDQVDEEAEARFFEKAYYGTSSIGNLTLNAENVDVRSQEPINISSEEDDKPGSDLNKAINLLSNLRDESSSESSSDENLSQSVISISSDQSSLMDIFKDKERYQTNMEALFLLITGNYPHCVLERAKKREQEYNPNQLFSRRINSYYSAATDEDDDDNLNEPPRKSSNTDLILGISNKPTQNHDRDVGIPKWFKNLPSNPKYWTVDPEDLCPNNHYYDSGSFNGICGNCELKGHTEEECTKSGPFCVICAREGHTNNDCSRRVCPICLKRGHDTRCHNKSQVNNTVCFRCKQMGHKTNRCPEIWRQYRFTTKPGPPVKFEQPEPKVKRCFNCGRIGHLGHECSRPSAYGQTLLYQGVTRFDKKDIFAKAVPESKLEYEVTEKQSIGDTSSAPSTTTTTTTTTTEVKKRTFDEPLYVSFTSGPLDSLPGPDKLLLDTSKDDFQNGNQKKKSKDNKRHSLQHDSNHTSNRKNRRKAFGGSSDHFSPIDRQDSSTLNGSLSGNIDRRKRRKRKLGNGNNLFISNGFTSKNHTRDNSLGRDYIGFRGKSPKDSPFNGSQNNHNYHGEGSSRSHSFGNGNHKQFRGKSPRNSQIHSSQFNQSPRHNYQQSRGKSPKSPNSRYRSQISPLRRIIEHRDKILKTNKRRNSERKILPNIANSPYLKLIDKRVWNSRSGSPSPAKRQKFVLKSRLSR